MSVNIRAKSLQVNRLLQLDSGPTPGHHHHHHHRHVPPPLPASVQMCGGCEGVRGAGVVNWRWTSADGTDNKAAIVPDQRRINRIPFSPHCLNGLQSFSLPALPVWANNISGSCCSNFWHLSEAGGRGATAESGADQGATLDGTAGLGHRDIFFNDVLKLKSRFENAAFVWVGQCWSSHLLTQRTITQILSVLHKAPKNRLFMNKNVCRTGQMYVRLVCYLSALKNV